MASTGGPAANAAHLLAAWGIRCAFAGVLGDDHYGQKILFEFENASIDTSLINIRHNTSTNLSVVLVNRQNGSRTIINRKSPRKPLGINTNVLDRINPKVLLLDGHQLQASLDALDKFPEAISILDAGSLREGTEKLAGEVDILASSERFAKRFCKLHELDSDESRRKCLRSLDHGKSYPVIVTLGEKGLIYGDRNGYRHQPAFPVKSIDTTAAGDIFHGALAYGALRKMPFEKILKFASVAAALSTTKQGGIASIPQIDRVHEKLESFNL